MVILMMDYRIKNVKNVIILAKIASILINVLLATHFIIENLIMKLFNVIANKASLKIMICITQFVRSAIILVLPVTIYLLAQNATRRIKENIIPQHSYVHVKKDILMMFNLILCAKSVSILVSPV
jgi:hypothetical protein